jgi:hypothetical protein
VLTIFWNEEMEEIMWHLYEEEESKLLEREVGYGRSQM